MGTTKARPGSVVLPVLQAALSGGSGPVEYACGEFGLVARTRSVLVRHGIDRRCITFCGYWKVGQARG